VTEPSGEPPGGDEDPRDLAQPVQKTVITSVTRPDTTWDQDRFREETRGSLAGRLVWMLAGTIFGAFLLLVLRWASPSDVKDLLTVILPPLIALTGSALGFYFGGKRD
jgi:hypothetical protein